MNNISLIGRMTADPELKSTPNGVSVCTFTLAVRRPRTIDKTDFINCVAWRNTADFISRYFCKGKMIALSGVLTSRIYEDQQQKKHKIVEVVADNVEFCGDKHTEEAKEKSDNEGFQEILDDEEMPF